MKRVDHLGEHNVIQFTYALAIKNEELAADRAVVAEQIVKYKLDKILVDARTVLTRPSAIDAFMHGIALAYEEPFRDTRIALLSVPIEPVDRFIEDVVVNRQGKFKCFESRDQALAWLKE